MFEADPLSQVWGGLASGVPGELRGLEAIHTSHGLLPWASVVAPAVSIAREGWEVDADLLYYMDVTIERRSDFFVEDESWATDFAPQGRKVRVGDWIRRERYADTLEIIGREGVGAFYGGRVANATVRANVAGGGVLSLEDLEGYRVEVREPVQVEYNGYLVTSCPAPAGGAAVLEIMKTMEGYEVDVPEEVDVTMHRLDEAMRFAFGARSVMGDPGFLGGMEEYEREITSEGFAAEVRRRIDDGRTLSREEYVPGNWEVPEDVSLFWARVGSVLGVKERLMRCSMARRISLLRIRRGLRYRLLRR